MITSAQDTRNGNFSIGTDEAEWKKHHGVVC